MLRNMNHRMYVQSCVITQMRHPRHNNIISILNKYLNTY